MCLLALSSVMVLAGGTRIRLCHVPQIHEGGGALAGCVVAAGNGNAISIPLSPLVTQKYLKWTYFTLAIVQTIAGVVYYVLFRKYDTAYAALMETGAQEDKRNTGDEEVNVPGVHHDHSHIKDPNLK